MTYKVVSDGQNHVDVSPEMPTRLMVQASMEGAVKRTGNATKPTAFDAVNARLNLLRSIAMLSLMIGLNHYTGQAISKGIVSLLSGQMLNRAMHGSSPGTCLSDYTASELQKNLFEADDPSKNGFELSSSEYNNRSDDAVIVIDTKKPGTSLFIAEIPVIESPGPSGYSDATDNYKYTITTRAFMIRQLNIPAQCKFYADNEIPYLQVPLIVRQDLPSAADLPFRNYMDQVFDPTPPPPLPPMEGAPVPEQIGIDNASMLVLN